MNPNLIALWPPPSSSKSESDGMKNPRRKAILRGFQFGLNQYLVYRQIS